MSGSSGTSGTGGSEGGGGGGHRRGPGGLFDDLAGVAGGAFSVIAGLRQEVEAMARAQADAMVQRLDLVRREELDAALEVARRAREAAEALEARVAALEARMAAAAPAPERGPPAVESPGAGGADSAA
ncbi:MAG: accessory factor UbiK family protein [Acetobacteraceae bacterium]|nr:accessory factor UbiK family protein [Acetobacteraceae bacterium]